MSIDRRPDDPDRLRARVQEGYARVARDSDGCCGAADEHGRRIGYSDAELESVPDGANLGVGCGNPTAIDSLRLGEVVVDLGSGAGMDAFLAARQVGPAGRVIGVDMTDEMIERARANARKAGLANVEFRKGNIEELPLDDASVDVIISNCVINLSPEKHRVFGEAYRVLRPGGRLMISDIVLERPLPEAVRESVDAYLGCVGGASLRGEYLETIANAGFRDVSIQSERSFGDVFEPDAATLDELGLGLEQAATAARAVTSLQLRAVK